MVTSDRRRRQRYRQSYCAFHLVVSGRTRASDHESRCGADCRGRDWATWPGSERNETGEATNIVITKGKPMSGHKIGNHRGHVLLAGLLLLIMLTLLSLTLLHLVSQDSPGISALRDQTQAQHLAEG